MSAADAGATRLAPIEERGPSRTDWAEKDQDAQSQKFMSMFVVQSHHKGWTNMDETWNKQFITWNSL